MKREMDSVLMMIFLLSFALVTTEEQKEKIEEIPFPDAPSAFQRIEKVERKPPGVKNDAEIFWEITQPPINDFPPPDVVDGNHPDDHEITTHDHVDKTIGHIPPTKRVKKILPPFEKSRNVRHIGDAENVTETPRPDEEIQGIRLVPNESADEEEEGPTMQKTIWDLLKEREEFNSDSTHLDGTEASGNETEVTTRPPTGIYDHFDADSAEVEFETENFNGGLNIEKHELPISYAMPWLQTKDVGEKSEVKTDIPQDVSKLLKLTQNEKSVNGVSVLNGGGGDGVRYGLRPSKWYLLLLTGNSTIVKLRRKDFTKYLKLNLAARLSVEYDDVRVNKVILAPPKVLVNISVFAPSDDVAEESQLDFKIDKGEAPLYKLAKTNATLLELSGEEYHVIRFLPFESEKPEAEAHKDVPNTVSMASRQNDVDFIIYTFLGSACACAALLTLFVTLNRYYKRVSDFVWFKPKPTAWKAQDSELDKDEIEGVSPAVIYSGGFPQIRGSWMTGIGAPPPFRHQHPNVNLGGSPPQRKPFPVYSELEDRPCASPRHSKLQIYNSKAERLVIPMPVRSKALGKVRSEGSDTHPLDVRISREKTGQDNPIFTT